MRLHAVIKDCRIQNTFNLNDGVYSVDIRPISSARSYEQIKKLWATIDDISREEYGDISQSNNIYLQILQMAGIRTDRILIPEIAIDDLKKKAKAVNVVSRETVNHQPYALVNVCFTGISEMTKAEVSEVIETAIRWASELGIETELSNG